MDSGDSAGPYVRPSTHCDGSSFQIKVNATDCKCVLTHHYYPRPQIHRPHRRSDDGDEGGWCHTGSSDSTLTRHQGLDLFGDPTLV